MREGSQPTPSVVRKADDKYALFISHSSADRLATVHGKTFKLIAYLKKQLEDHIHPDETDGNGRPKRFRVCTFEEDFQLAGTVKLAIRDRLRSSGALLVLCSKHAAESEHVQDELAFFKETKPEAPLIGGVWKSRPSDAFPTFFSKDTLGANLAPSVVQSFDDWKKQLQDESHKIAARAWKRSTEEVHDRFRQERRRKKRRQRVALAAALLLVLGLGGFAFQQFRWIKRQKAHDAAIVELKNHGFDVAEVNEDDVALIFSPPIESPFSDPFKDHATRGLAAARNLIGIKSIRLGGRAVGDRTLAVLPGLPVFEELMIERAGVTDASIPILESLDGLRVLGLDRTLITKEAVAKLGERPKLTIQHSVERFVDLSGWDFRDALGAAPPVSKKTGGGFSKDQWTRIFEFAGKHAKRYGYPERRDGSLLLGSFNVRKLSRKARRHPATWLFLAKVIHAFDLIAIQEAMEDVSGLRHLAELLRPTHKLVYSAKTGASPLSPGVTERLAFFYRRQTVRAKDVAGSLRLERLELLSILVDDFPEYAKVIERVRDFEEGHVAAAALAGRPVSTSFLERNRRRTLGKITSPLGFLRSPFIVAFELGDGEHPYRVLAVNSHLRYGTPNGRWREAQLLIERLAVESVHRALAEADERTTTEQHEDVLMFADLNLDYHNKDSDRKRLDDLFASVRNRIRTRWKGKSDVWITLPFLDVHPERAELLRTNIRKSRTADHIGFFVQDGRLARLPAKFQDPMDGHADYGVFDFASLFAEALHGERVKWLSLDTPEAKEWSREFFRNFEYQVSDHVPIWVRIPVPGPRVDPPDIEQEVPSVDEEPQPEPERAEKTTSVAALVVELSKKDADLGAIARRVAKAGPESIAAVPALVRLLLPALPAYYASEDESLSSDMDAVQVALIDIAILHPVEPHCLQMLKSDNVFERGLAAELLAWRATENDIDSESTQGLLSLIVGVIDEKPVKAMAQGESLARTLMVRRAAEVLMVWFPSHEEAAGAVVRAVVAGGVDGDLGDRLLECKEPIRSRLLAAAKARMKTLQDEKAKSHLANLVLRIEASSENDDE